MFGYDDWKTRAPEDERGYYADAPEPDEDEEPDEHVAPVDDDIEF